jgi:hypothetical protein
MNKYLIGLVHHFGTNEGVMTIVLKAGSEAAVRDYIAKNVDLQTWYIQTVTLIGVDVHA